MTRSLRKKIFFISTFIGTYLIFTPGALDEFLVGRFIWLSAVGIGGVLFLGNKSKLIHLNYLDLTIGSLYLLTVISLSWAGLFSAGLLPVQTTCVFVIFYFLFRTSISELDNDFFRKLFIVLTSLILAFTFLELFNLARTEGLGGKIVYTVSALSGHKNILCSYLLILIGINLWFLEPGKPYKWTIILILLQILTIFLLRSRTSLVALVVFVLIYLLHIIISRSISWVKVSKWMVAGFLVLGSTVYLFLTRLGGTTDDLNRLNPLTYLKDASFIERVFVWYKTIELIKDRWILGYGAGNWKIVFPSKSISGGYRLETRDLMFTRVHNDFLEWWAEQGILGFILFTTIFVMVLVGLLKTLKLIKKENTRIMILLGLVIMYMFISLFEFPKERLEIQIIWAFILALIVKSCPAYFAQQACKWWNVDRSGKPIRHLAVVLLLINLPLGYFLLKGEFHTLKMLKAQNLGQWMRVESESKKAYNSLYQITPVAIAVKWYEGLALYHQGKYNQALEAFEIATNHTPYFIRLLNDYASCRVQLGDLEGARDLYLKVMFINPKFEEGMFNLAYVYAQIGDFENAYLWLNKTTSNPQKREEFMREIEVLKAAIK